MLQRRGKFLPLAGIDPGYPIHSSGRLAISLSYSSGTQGTLQYLCLGYAVQKLAIGASNFANTRFLLNPESRFAFIKITVF